MSEMKISNTLVNDSQNQCIAYAEQIIDRAIYKNLGLTNPNMRDIAEALDKLQGQVNIGNIKSNAYFCKTDNNANDSLKSVTIQNFIIDEYTSFDDNTIIYLTLVNGNTSNEIKLNINNAFIIPIYIANEGFSYNCSENTILILSYDKRNNKLHVVGGADNFSSAWE